MFFLQFLSLCLLFRCLQFMSEKEVEAYVLIILHARIVINKKGGRNHIPLPKNAMLFSKKVGYMVFVWYLIISFLYLVMGKS